ncbi:MAG: glucosyl-3-phosphoglycerate synthase [Actinomycetota bacterium]|nr:glucosyl-3-phosphoglycerate synthase [Actinomycetota bacterium]
MRTTPGTLATAHHRDFAVDELVRRKGGQKVTLCLPARDEERTVGAIVRVVRRHLCGRSPLVDEVLVVDDGSTDATAAEAAAAGGRVVRGPGVGKGDAMRAGLMAAGGDLVVYCDADVRPFPPHFVVGLVGPLLCDQRVGFVKGFYERPPGPAGGGGRVTELVAKPALRALLPQLATFHQPLAGECAGRRQVLEAVPFVAGYGVDVALIIDVATRFGFEAMAQVDLGRRLHRNRPLAELGPQAEAVLRTVLARAGVGAAVAEHPPLAGEPVKVPTQ